MPFCSYLLLVTLTQYLIREGTEVVQCVSFQFVADHVDEAMTGQGLEAVTPPANE